MIDVVSLEKPSILVWGIIAAVSSVNGEWQREIFLNVFRNSAILLVQTNTFENEFP